MKTITDIRKSFREKCLVCANDFIEVNKLMNKLAIETDEILGFMETTIKLNEVPKPE